MALAHLESIAVGSNDLRSWDVSH